MKDTNLLLSKIVEFRNKTLAFYSVSLPELVETRNRRPTRVKIIAQEIIVKIWLFIHSFNVTRKLPKYIFLSKNFPDLMSILPPSEVMIIGGRGELLLSIKKGYRFCWSAPIFYGFSLFIFSGKNKLYSAVISSLRRMFTKEINKRYLILNNDSQPEGMTLSFGLQSISMLNIVCVEHGIINFEPTRIKTLPEGESCQFNLLWDVSQKFFFKDDKNHASFVLGLPYEVSPPKNNCREVILVGDCGISSDSVRYFYMLSTFCRMYRILEAAGINVFYRPHPEDNIEYIRSVFSNVCNTNKSELLAINKKIFIGYESSLIFEAGKFGHTTVGIDAIELVESKFFQHKDNRAFDVDFEVSSSDFENLPALVLDIFDRSSSAAADEDQNLKYRFYKCIKQIDQFQSTYQSDSLI